MKRNFEWKAALGGLVAAMGIAGGSAQAQYVIMDLGALPGGSHIVGFALNNRGMVAGYGDNTATQERAALYGFGNAQDLGGLGGGSSTAFALDANGTAVGFGAVSSGAIHAFVANGGVTQDLGLLPHGTYAYAYAIAANGVIVGEGDTTGTSGKGHGFINTAGTLQVLGTLGGLSSMARFVNRNGQVAGDSDTADGNRHTFLYANGTMTDLRTFGGYNSSVVGLNRRGDVAGTATDASEYEHAFLYDGATLQNLGTLGGPTSSAAALNDSGQVTGNATLISGATHAFLYTNGVMTDLGTLGGNFSTSAAINNRGDIVGYSLLTDNKTEHAFLYRSGAMTDLNILLPANSGWILNEAQFISDTGFIVGTGRHNGALSTYLLGPSYVGIGGQVAFEGVPNLAATVAPLGLLTIDFRLPNSTDILFSLRVPVAPDANDSTLGDYALANLPAGTYDIGIRSDISLRRAVMNVAVTGNGVLPSVLLPGGNATGLDEDGTTRVDLKDFEFLVNAFGSDIHDPTSDYDAHTDFNYDGLVELGDFGILVNNFGNSGDP